MARYTLYYWPGLQGRGEFVRLALEQAGAAYKDVARSGGGALDEVLADEAVSTPPFAVPALRDGDVLVAQTAAILLYLGPRLGLAPAGEPASLWAHQIQLTLADLVAEAHDTHHPVGNGSYYEEQKPEAARAAEQFRSQRMPKYLDWLETILARNPEGAAYLVGDRLGYVDLSAFQVVEGLRYAFPRAAAAALAATPLLVDLVERVRTQPKIAAYLRSRRRQAFNETGIFRHYPELDDPASR